MILLTLAFAVTVLTQPLIQKLSGREDLKTKTLGEAVAIPMNPQYDA